MNKEFDLELIRCKWPILLIEFSVILFIISIVVSIISYIEYLNCSKENEDCFEDKNILHKLGLIFILLNISFVMLFVAILYSAYHKCFKIATIGTIITLLVPGI